MHWYEIVNELSFSSCDMRHKPPEPVFFAKERPMCEGTRRVLSPCRVYRSSVEAMASVTMVSVEVFHQTYSVLSSRTGCCDIGIEMNIIVRPCVCRYTNPFRYAQYSAGDERRLMVKAGLYSICNAFESREPTGTGCFDSHMKLMNDSTEGQHIC